MEQHPGDAPTSVIAETSPRRSLLRLVAGAPLAGILGWFGSGSPPGAVAVACVPAGKRCGKEKPCCKDGQCQGGKCRCKRGRPACFAGKWGGKGSGNGEFKSPYGVAVDSQGHVYVADTDNHRIQVFSGGGKFLGKWGGQGGGDGQFEIPFGVAVHDDGAGTVTVYVADTHNHRIQKFGSNGGHLLTWGSQGSGNDEFEAPSGVAVHDDGAGTVTVYVADQYNHRIQQFTSGGGFQGWWGSQGTGPGQFDHPFGVAVDQAGFVYVADTTNHRIQKFEPNGDFVTMWGKNGGDGTPGTGDGEFNHPLCVAVDAAGFVSVADLDNHRIQLFTRNGGFVGRWGREGGGNGEFVGPGGVAVDGEGRVYVADVGNYRTQKFLLA